MNYAQLNNLVSAISSSLWGWPTIIFVVCVGLLATFMLNFTQFRYFAKAWQLVLSPGKGSATAELTPFQAFLNALSASVGNGSLAGMATAIYAGGPGAAFWLFAIGFLSLIIRFCEVYLSSAVTDHPQAGSALGGPMIYLRKVPGGSFLPYLYTLFCLGLCIFGGTGMQCNSIRIGVENSFGVNPLIIAAVLFVFVAYIMLGGAQRIVRVSDALTPIKVGVFFICAIIALVYHWQSLIPALKLIIIGAFEPRAISAGALGYTLQNAIRFGIARSVNSSEAGLGTAGILFGATGGKNPVSNGIMSMVATFISYYLVCFVIMWIIVASGVWNSGLTSTALTIAAFKTVFGNFGAWIVTILSVLFGLGVLVAYAFIGRECWRFLFGSSSLWMYSVLYSVMAIVGALAQVDIVWNALDMVNGCMLLVNLYAIVYLLPDIRRGVIAYQEHRAS